ncbi:hypothetical protein ABE28_018425 [Peribacillus muralis]|uniref:DUF4064 domain-containing protein n=1 Tax=Peribacillus muralis TaxID=264697 RepID=A0A1B3XT12_9BACI|nr:hypothetical protein [Peribacillus muralis]AOH56346.1 hypothetical protein ABE28_018425 [Peribacillus muralis]
MKNSSRWSIVFAVMGAAAFGSSFISKAAFDFLMIFGFAASSLGMLLSFGAMYKNERGKTKFMAVAAFFLGFILVWNEPFQVIRLLTWLRN